MAIKKKTTATKKPSTKKTTKVQAPAKVMKLSKSRTDKIICGVAGGLAAYFNVDAVLIRLGFILFLASGGAGFWVYIVLCLLLPETGSENKTTKEVIEENATELEETAKNFATDAEDFGKKRNTKLWLGIIVILIGLSLFFNNLGFWDFGEILRAIMKAFWPLFIVGAGVVILVKNQND